MIISQAPGTKVHYTGIPWNDASGDRLRGWLGVDREQFYDVDRLAIMPMGLCYPGRLKNGGDAPPRPECAPLWHDKFLRLMPQIELFLLIGGYAQTRYIGPGSSMTERVRNFAAAPELLRAAASVLAHHWLGEAQSLVQHRRAAGAARGYWKADAAMIELTNGALSLGVEPAHGASIAWFRTGGFHILRETPAAASAAGDSRAFAAFPLIPYSNRIRVGSFSFSGVTYTLRRDEEDPRNALHGTARFQPWQLEAQTASSARCVFDFTPQPELWPFAYSAWQEFTLLADRLRVSIGLTNRHDAPAPFGIGLHPYFERHEPNFLQFAAGYVWAKDADDIPIRADPDIGKFDFTEPRAIELEDLIDHCYGDWARTAAVAFSAFDKRIEIRASPVFRNAVVFTPEDKDYFAVEPVSHRPDAVNPNGDPHDGGMDILDPGATLAGTIEIVLL